MDRIQFVKSIEYNDFEKSIVRFFDENMALYNLIGEYENIQCIKGNVDDKSISFSLKFNNKEDCEKMYFLICGEQICIYGRLYSIHTKITTNILNIELIDIKELCDGC